MNVSAGGKPEHKIEDGAESTPNIPRSEQILGAVKSAMKDNGGDPETGERVQTGSDPAVDEYVEAELGSQDDLGQLESLANKALMGAGSSMDVVQALAPLKLESEEAYQLAVRSIAKFAPSGQADPEPIDDAVVAGEDPSNRYGGPEAPPSNL